MPWKRFQFKDQVVFARVLADGKPIVRNGLVEIRYRLGATKSYRGSRDTLVEIEGEGLVEDSEMGGTTAASAAATAIRETPTKPADAETIVLYTDGACSGNPGPAGIGVFMKHPACELELSEYIGSATNNIAELTAILRGLEKIDAADRERDIHLYTDSGWSLGVLIGGWKAKANLELIAQIKDKMQHLPNLQLLKVRGHAGDPGNEMADYLATMAVRRESSLERARPRKGA